MQLPKNCKVSLIGYWPLNCDSNSSISFSTCFLLSTAKVSSATQRTKSPKQSDSINLTLASIPCLIPAADRLNNLIVPRLLKAEKFAGPTALFSVTFSHIPTTFPPSPFFKCPMATLSKGRGLLCPDFARCLKTLCLSNPRSS